MLGISILCFYNHRKNMLKIGLTGGIGCGKSTVCHLFSELGVPIIDADQIAHALVEPGKPALIALGNNFGPQILHADGSLNRASLRDLVFSQPEQRLRLNAIMHPLVYAQIEQEINKLAQPYCIIAVPLLLETEQAQRVDRVLVIDCDKTTQIQRVKLRDQLKTEQIQAIIDSQMPRSQRLNLADDIIDNSTTSDQLAEQVKRLHNSYNFLATVRTSPA